MKEPVYFLPVDDQEDDAAICQRLKGALAAKDVLAFVKARDMVALKTHFGEKGSRGYVRPVYFRMLAEVLKEKNALPFLTETQTLYAGQRSNAVDHIQTAYEHGFTPDNTRLPIIMADGLLGDEELEVAVSGKLYTTVAIASLIVRSQAMVLVTHFTGHVATGFGGALKNLGMGCSSRKGKLQQHSTAKPSIKKKSCTGCGMCVQWCPAGALKLTDGVALMNREICIGCGECLAVCRFGAVAFTWSETYEQLQRKVVEYAAGVSATKKDKMLCISFLTRITRDCDCMGSYNKIIPDIGILFSLDPVAIDAASLDLVEERAGKPLSRMAFDIPYRVQIEHARAIGYGHADYDLIQL